MIKSFNNHIIILGSGRSGTSWLCEVIATQHRYRLLFEPDHPHHVPQGKFIADQWFPDNRFDRKSLQYLKQVFKNRVDNDWIAQMSNRKFKMHLWPFIPKFYVIKFVRANVSMTTFAATFQIPVVYITRHPHAVIFSQQRVKFPWLYDLSLFKKQIKLQQYLLDTTGIDLDEEYSDLQKLAIRWGIENLLFKIPDSPTVRHYRFEDLKGNLPQLKEVFHFAKMNIPANLEEKLNRPSSKTHPRSNILKSAKQEMLSGEDKNVVNAILLKFPFQLYDL